MLTKSNIVLSVALILSTASAAMAAPKHPVYRPNTAFQQHIPAGTYLSFDPVRSTDPASQPSNISPRGLQRLERLIEDFQDIGFNESIGN
jgi:hypothetical protein